MKLHFFTKILTILWKDERFWGHKEIKLMKNKGKIFLNLTEAAEMLGIHRTTLHSWLKKDKELKKNKMVGTGDFKCPPYGRMGGRYRFLREDIEKFIKASMEN
jgi:predicted DNA-binding transcriptional regulator AlpA